MFKNLHGRLPTREQLSANRWLRWLGPYLHHPRLWHWSRRGVAIGVAMGVFFGLLIPVAQIPFAATAAIVLRANVPAAIASTLVTNPVTFAPIYYAAYHAGAWIIGETEHGAESEAARAERLAQEDAGFWQRVSGLGGALLTGLLLFATLAGLLAYGIITLGWRIWVWRRRQRKRLWRR